jgi:hypothetical protein
MSEGNLISGGVEPGDDPGVKESKPRIGSRGSFPWLPIETIASLDVEEWVSQYFRDC